MMLLDGKKLSDEIRENLTKKIALLKMKPGLAVVLVGKDPASILYTDKKVRSCEQVGIYSEKHELPEDATEKSLLDLIGKLNKDKNIHGILVQMPVPKHIDAKKVMAAVSPAKDVDGFHPENIGRTLLGMPAPFACTPKGVIRLLDEYRIELAGKDVCMVGASDIVGKPLAAMLLNREATVTVCHIRTRDLKSHTIRADIVISATGVPHLIKSDMVKEGAIVIDVGTTKVDGKLVGDVDFDAVKGKCSYITPVPGGVGPMTIACLMENTYLAYRQQAKLQG